MKKLTDTKYNEMYRIWKGLSEPLRQQLYAKELFGLNVSDEYGLIVEPKDTGGIRLLPLPPCCDPTKGANALQDAMAAKGWVYQVQKHHRSTLCTVRMLSPIKGLEVVPHFMPENEGRYFAALLAVELEKELDNENPE